MRHFDDLDSRVIQSFGHASYVLRRELMAERILPSRKVLSRIWIKVFSLMKSPPQLTSSRASTHDYQALSLRSRNIWTGTTSAINAKIMRIARADAPG